MEGKTDGVYSLLLSVFFLLMVQDFEVFANTSSFPLLADGNWSPISRGVVVNTRDQTLSIFDFGTSSEVLLFY